MPERDPVVKMLRILDGVESLQSELETAKKEIRKQELLAWAATHGMKAGHDLANAVGAKMVAVSQEAEGLRVLTVGELQEVTRTPASELQRYALLTRAIDVHGTDTDAVWEMYLDLMAEFHRHAELLKGRQITEEESRKEVEEAIELAENGITKDDLAALVN